MRSSSVVLLSGGLDSLAAFHWAHEESDLVLGITFDYGQRSAQQEIESAGRICRHYDVKHLVIKLPWYSSLKGLPLTDPAFPVPKLKISDLKNDAATRQSAQAVWIPNRNGVFVNIAASVAENWLANWIVVGFNKEEAKTFPDNSADFVDALNKSFKYSTRNKVLVQSPMGSFTKTEIVRWALEHRVDLKFIWSCYLGEEKMCGSCESCLRCRRALKDGGAVRVLEALF